MHAIATAMERVRRVRAPRLGIGAVSLGSARSGEGAHYHRAVPPKRKDRRPGAAIQARPVSAPRGRVTPKGTSDTTSGRYTPPIPKEFKVSPRWVPWAMGILLIGGMLVIITNYLNVLPGEEADNRYLLGGLGMITAGFIVATKWR